MINYALPLKYFMIMSILLLLSGLWMFVLHSSLSIEGTLSYYSPKSFFGLLETVTPHLFGMGILVFVVTHFFAIIEGVESKTYKSFSLGLFMVMLVSNLVGFFISETSVFFAIVKLVSTLLFVLYTLLALFKVYKLS